MKIQFLLLAGVLLLSACGQRNTKMAESTENEIVATTPTSIDIEPAQVKSMRATVKDDTVAVQLSAADVRALAEILRAARYDTEWNDSGIQVKMATPDHTVIVTYRQAGAPEDFLQLWAGNPRLLFAAKWYLLTPEALARAEALLERIAR